MGPLITKQLSNYSFAAIGPIVAVKSSNDVPTERLQAQSCKMLQPLILPRYAKIRINAFSTGICLAKYLTHNISATVHDIAMVSKDHL